MRKLGANLPGTIALLLAPIALCQNTEPRFEIASIHPASPGSRAFRMDVGDGQVILANVPLHMIIEEAYGLASFQQEVMGRGHLMLTPFDIQAKAETAALPNELRRMLQSLLKDRFRMTTHFEQRTTKGLLMTAARSGLRLKSAAPGTPTEPPHFTPTEFLGQNASLEEIAAALARRVYTPIEDKTGLDQTNSRYTFSVKFDGGVPPLRDEMLDVISQALGLRFVGGNVNARILVIDNLEAPSEN